jgi:hypothetical protein
MFRTSTPLLSCFGGVEVGETWDGASRGVTIQVYTVYVSTPNVQNKCGVNPAWPYSYPLNRMALINGQSVGQFKVC